MTPGPWKRDTEEGFTSYIMGGQGFEDVVCHMAGVGPTDDANGKLIAAAPEMLEALRLVDLYFTYKGWKDDRVHLTERVRAVVASQADGGSEHGK